MEYVPPPACQPTSRLATTEELESLGSQIQSASGDWEVRWEGGSTSRFEVAFDPDSPVWHHETWVTTATSCDPDEPYFQILPTALTLQADWMAVGATTNFSIYLHEGARIQLAGVLDLDSVDPAFFAEGDDPDGADRLRLSFRGSSVLSAEYDQASDVIVKTLARCDGDCVAPVQ